MFPPIPRFRSQNSFDRFAKTGEDLLGINGGRSKIGSQKLQGLILKGHGKGINFKCRAGLQSKAIAVFKRNCEGDANGTGRVLALGCKWSQRK